MLLFVQYNVFLSVHISIYRRGEQPAASRQIESLPVVVVLMKGIGAWLLGVQLDSWFYDIEFPTDHFTVDLSNRKVIYHQLSLSNAYRIWNINNLFSWQSIDRISCSASMQLLVEDAGNKADSVFLPFLYHFVFFFICFVFFFSYRQKYCVLSLPDVLMRMILLNLEAPTNILVLSLASHTVIISTFAATSAV